MAYTVLYRLVQQGFSRDSEQLCSGALETAQREEQYLSDFSVVCGLRKTTNSRHLKPPLRGGTMRYRADITKQRRATLLQYFTRATCCVRLVHAKLQPSDAVGMRIAAAVADQHLQVAGETDEQPRTIAAKSEDRALFPRWAPPLDPRAISLILLGGYVYLLKFFAFRCSWH